MEKTANKSPFAAMIDQLTFSILVLFLSFITTIFWLRRIKPAAVIAVCGSVAAFAMLRHAGKSRESKQKAKEKENLMMQLQLERMLLSPLGELPVEGFTHEGGDVYQNEAGGRLALFLLHPADQVTPTLLLQRLRADPGLSGFLSTAPFHEECLHLADRLSLTLVPPDELTKKSRVTVSKEQVDAEWEQREKRRREQKARLRQAAFQKSRAKKYLFSGLFLFALSYFMGAFQGFYLTFALGCLTLSGLSMALGKGE